MMVKIKYDEFLIWLVIVLFFGLIQHWMVVLQSIFDSRTAGIMLTDLFNDNMLFFCTSLIIVELYESLRDPELKPYVGRPAYFLVYFIIPMGLVFFITFLYYNRNNIEAFAFSNGVLSSFLLSLLYACFVKLKVNVFTK